MSTTRATQGTIRGIHVLVAMLLFFGITIAVNAALVTYALSTFSGEDVAQPYQKGLAWNRTLAARREEDARGWKAAIAVTRTKQAGALVTVNLTDRSGAALAGLAVTARLRRPTDSRLDRTIELAPAGGSTWEARIDGIAAGQWDAIISVKQDGRQALEAGRRLVLE